MNSLIRKIWKHLSTLLILTLLLFGCQQHPQLKPNIIFILADDLGYGELGCYGQEFIQTPHIDKLASEGIRFTQFYSGSPVCAPSRCVLMTGMHTGHSYVRDNYEMGGYLDEEEGGQLPLMPGTKTIARVLKQNGYVTGAIGKWGLGGPGSTGLPTRQGFDYFYGYLCQKQAHNYYPSHLWRNDEWDTLANGYFPQHQKFEGDPNNLEDFEKYKGTDYAQDLMANEALRFIREHKDESFFLYLPFPVPHLALQVPDESLEMYLGTFEEKPYLGENGYLPHPYPKSAYAAMITRMDMHVGQIMDLLIELGIEENTVVMFSSDNGATFLEQVDTELFNSHSGLRGHKGNLYEGGIRVPFIIKWSGISKPGKVSNFIGCFQDIMPTLLNISGIEIPDYLDGVSILPEISGHIQPEHNYLYWEFPNQQGWQAVRKDNWKAVRKGIRENPFAPIELYNLDDDFSEQRDLAGEYPEIVERMKEFMKKAHFPSSYFPLPIDSIDF